VLVRLGSVASNTNTTLGRVTRATPQHRHRPSIPSIDARRRADAVLPPLDCLIGSHYVDAIIIIQGFFTTVPQSTGFGSEPDCPRGETRTDRSDSAPSRTYSTFEPLRLFRLLERQLIVTTPEDCRPARSETEDASDVRGLLHPGKGGWHDAVTISSVNQE